MLRVPISCHVFFHKKTFFSAIIPVRHHQTVGGRQAREEAAISDKINSSKPGFGEYCPKCPIYVCVTHYTGVTCFVDEM